MITRFIVFKIYPDYESHGNGGWGDFWRSFTAHDEAVKAITEDKDRENYDYELVDLEILRAENWASGASPWVQQEQKALAEAAEQQELLEAWLVVQRDFKIKHGRAMTIKEVLVFKPSKIYTDAERQLSKGMKWEGIERIHDVRPLE